MKITFLLFFILNSALAFTQVAEFLVLDRNIKLPKTKEGELVHFSYTVLNNGKAPLLISEIKVICTCTTFEFPKEPIPPNGTGVIKVTFDTKGKIGYQDRTLDVYSNAENSPYSLRFRIVVDNKAEKK